MSDFADALRATSRAFVAMSDTERATLTQAEQLAGVVAVLSMHCHMVELTEEPVLDALETEPMDTITTAVLRSVGWERTDHRERPWDGGSRWWSQLGYQRDI